MGATVVLPIGIALLLGFLCCDTNACREAEGVALLKLKHSLTDPLHQLSSWKEGTDCCMSWTGVRCHNNTGHVVRLKLHNMSLGGEINPSLTQLNHLRFIDLSLNNFGGARIPGFIGSLTKMTYLNLSSANFGGNLPHQLGNLSSLNYLDLSSSDDMFPNRSLETNSLAWISNLSNLRYLSMDRVNLMNATDWLLEINKLTSLSVLQLSPCQINQIPISPPFFNLSSLSVIDLSYNNIFNSTFLQPWLLNMTSLTYLDLGWNGLSGPIFEAFRNMTSLTYLDLSWNSLSGPISEAFRNMTSLTYLGLQYNQLGGDIPISMGNLCSLQVLDLSSNNFIGEMAGLVDSLSRCYPNPAPNLTTLHLSGNSLTGSIPQSLGMLTSLQFLYLNDNKLNGTVPEDLGQLSKLTDLDVSSNSLVGDVSEAHFARLSRLNSLSLSHNSLTLTMSPNWVPPFQLRYIYMSSCQLGTLFPSWLQTQKGLYELDFSNAGISDTMPYWFWNLTSAFVYLNISHNQIRGSLPVSLESIIIQSMDLGSNLLEGPLPQLNSNIEELYLYENSFSGPLPSDIGQGMPRLSFLYLSGNLFNGSIPHSICDISLNVIDLSDNRLSGELPRCWNRLQNVGVLDVGHNMLSGRIPESMGSMFSLNYLHLNNNSFTGEIPVSLKNCTSLVALDLGENNLSGNIPSWLGESLLELKFLRLRSNMFRGRIPIELSLLTSLQLLDIANNSLSGSIPPSLGNMTGMYKIDPISDNYSIDELIFSSIDTRQETHNSIYEDNMVVYIEGRDYKYTTTLALVRSIDLSSNKLSGEIPEELTNLSGLIFLSLANNMLTGRIPKGIGNLGMLLMLDLSINKLTGVIPQRISALMFLNHLNLSYNNLSGRIPSGSQLQVLNDPYIYIGNEYLCGSPLTITCTYDKSPSMEIGGSGKDGSDAIWFYSGIALGFAAGVLGLWGVLVFKTSWRFFLFRLLDGIYDWLYGTIALSVAKVRRSAIISCAIGRCHSMT